MIKQIEIKGKMYPLKVSFNAEKRLQMEFGPDATIQTMFSNLDQIEPVFYGALQSGCYEMGQELDIKREDIPFILDNVAREFVKIVPEFYSKVVDASTSTKKKNH
jgi:hypothetical protein